MNSESPIWKTLIHNYCDFIGDLVNHNDINIPNLCYKKPTKALEYISIGHHNIILIFISYLHYPIHDNYPTGDNWVKVTNNNLNVFNVIGFYYFRRFTMDGLLNSVLSKPYSPVENFNRFIKRDHTLLPDFKYQALWNNCNHSAITTSCN